MSDHSPPEDAVEALAAWEARCLAAETRLADHARLLEQANGVRERLARERNEAGLVILIQQRRISDAVAERDEALDALRFHADEGCKECLAFLAHIEGSGT